LKPPFRIRRSAAFMMAAVTSLIESAPVATSR
jgi:hypothetical protein